MKKKLYNLAKKIAKAVGIQKITPRYGVRTAKLGDFFQELDRQKITYVALRWFEELPAVKPGEDIDLLVKDSDFYKLRRMCRGAKENGQYTLFDIYPASNLVANYSYYIPALAMRILEGRIRNKHGVWTPNQRDYFFELAYHALYHKGYKAGIPSKYSSKTAPSYKHDFNVILTGLAQSNGISLESGFSMEELEGILEQYGWKPPIDVYYRRSKANQWVYDRAQELTPPEWRHNQGATVFIIREFAYPDVIDYLRKLFTEFGVSVERENHLTDEQAKYLMNYTRGGDWGELDTSRQSLGLASYVIVATKGMKDLAADEQTPSGAVLYDWAKEIKRLVREKYVSEFNHGKKVHIMHTSDNGVEAAYYEAVLDQALEQD